MKKTKKKQPTLGDLDIKTIRELRDQLVAAQVKPFQGEVFFMVTTKTNLRKACKALGFTKEEIRDVLSRAEKVEELQ